MHAMIDIAYTRDLLRRHAKTFLTTFACILTAVACILGLVYTSFQSIVLDSVARQYSDFAGQLDSLSDILSTTIQNYGMQIFYAPSVLALREDAALSQLDQVYALRELSSYISSNDFVDSIQIYNRKSGYIYSTDSNVISAPIDQYSDQDAAQLFRSLTSDDRARPIRRTAFSQDPVRIRQYFSFLFFETTSEDEPTGGILMLNVDYNRYLDVLLSFHQQGDCVLLNERGEVLTVRSEEIQDQIPLFFDEIRSGNQEESGYLLKKIGGQQTVCLHFRLESSNWYYLKIMKLSECLPRLLELKNALIAGILIGFSLLAVCSLGVLLFLYFPVYQVRTTLQKVGLSRRGELAGQVSQLAQQSQAYQKSNALQALLEGRNSNIPPSLTAPFVLVILEPQDSSPIRQLLAEQHPNALTYHGNGCEVILLAGTQTDDARELCESLANTHCRHCFCGLARTTLSEVPESYQILCEMRRQVFWSPNQKIFLEAAFVPKQVHSSFTDRMGSDLVSALRTDNMEQVCAVWKEIKAVVQADCYQEQVFAFRRVASILEKQLPALKPLISDDFWTQLSDIQVLDQKFCTAFQQIIQNSLDLHKQRIDQLSQQVTQRITSGYSDSNLSPTRIADEMGMSSAYLGRVFRESMQISINQYINQVRIQRATELLRDTTIPVETIAGEVGFSNAKYFYVVFKNITGQTPLQFRKSCSSDEKHH